MASIEIISTYCAETDSKNRSQVTNNSFDVGAFSDRVNESYAFFPLASLPAGAIVTSGTLKLRQYQGDYWNKGIARRPALISFRHVTWDNKPAESAARCGLRRLLRQCQRRQDGRLTPIWATSVNVSHQGMFRASAGDSAKGFRPSTYSGGLKAQNHAQLL